MGERAKLAIELSQSGATQVVGALKGVVSGIGGIGGALSTANQQLFYFMNNARAIGRVGMDIGKAVIGPNIQFDQYREMLTFIEGSAEKAEAKIMELFRLGNAKGFKFAEIYSLYTNLQRVGGVALTSAEDMDLWVNASKRSGRDVAGVAQQIAQAWFQLESGRDINTVTRSLQQLGIITPDAVQKLRQMQEAGAASGEMWNALKAEIRTSTASVSTAAETWTDLTNKVSNYAEIIKQMIGQSLFGAMKQDVEDVGASLDRVFDSGKIQSWTTGISKELAGAYEKIKGMTFSGVGFEDILLSLDEGKFLTLMGEITKTAALNFWEVIRWGAQQYGDDIQRALIPERLHGVLGLTKSVYEGGQPTLSQSALAGVQMLSPLGALNRGMGMWNEYQAATAPDAGPLTHTVNPELINRIRYGDEIGQSLSTIRAVSQELTGAGLSISGIRMLGPGGETKTFFDRKEADEFIRSMEGSAASIQRAAQALEAAANKAGVF